MEQTLYKMVRSYHTGRLVGRVSRDSTAVSAREAPVNKKKDVKPSHKPTRLQKQLSLFSGEALQEPDTACGQAALIDLNTHCNDARGPMDPAGKERFRIPSASVLLPNVRLSNIFYKLIAFSIVDLELFRKARY